MSENSLLSIQSLVTKFPIKQTILEIITRKPQKFVTAVDHVTFDVKRGETVGLVGESGCGKSTLAKTICRLYTPDEGKVLYDGNDVFALDKNSMKQIRYKMQMVFQDPYSSLNPRMTVRQMLYEEMNVHKLYAKNRREEEAIRILDLVGMDAHALDRYPSQFSGGQRQRISVARALLMKPDILVADEPVSALDVSIQAQVINLLIDLKKELNLTMLFISHDLRVIRYISDRVVVMYLGKVMEVGDTEALYDRPHHPYTDILMRAAPEVDPDSEGHEYVIQGETPSPLNIPSGCRFHPRCPYATDKCRQSEPPLTELEPGRFASCHYPLNPGRQ